MALINYHTIVIYIIIIIAIECVPSKYIQLKILIEKMRLKKRRQITVPALITALGIFVGEFLIFVANLLDNIENSLPIILGGLGDSLDIIVTQLGLLVESISTRKRQDSSLNAVIQIVTNGENAVSNIENLSELNQLNTLLNLATSSSITDIESQFEQISANLNKTINRIQSNTDAITQALISLINYLGQLGSSLTNLLPGTTLSAVTTIFQSVPIAQNVILTNLSDLDNALFNIPNSTVIFLSSTTTQLVNIVSQSIVSCVSNTKR